MSDDLVAALVRDSQDWATPLVESYASGNRRLMVRVLRETSARTFDRQTNSWTEPESREIYYGEARYWPVSAVRNLGADTGTQEELGGRVSIDAGGTRPRQDDVVVVTEDPDGVLTDARFTVTAVSTTGQFAYGWHLEVTGIGPSPNDPEDS